MIPAAVARLSPEIGLLQSGLGTTHSNIHVPIPLRFLRPNAKSRRFATETRLDELDRLLRIGIKIDYRKAAQVEHRLWAKRYLAVVLYSVREQQQPNVIADLRSIA